MTGTITYILARAGFRAMNGHIADERRRLAGAEPPAAYVSYDARLLAGAGWYGYRIAFKGGDRDMVRRALAMLAEYYIIRDGYEYYDGGVYVVRMLLRQRVPHYGIGGGESTPEPDALNFYMPNGGTISLNKTGSPTVVRLEYSLDRGTTWTVWPEDGRGNRSLTLTAGQRMYVRNTSETSTTFSSSQSDYYSFNFTNNVAASGFVDSLLCRNISNAIISSYVFYRLFMSCKTLIKAPNILTSTNMKVYCFGRMFAFCSNMKTAPESLPSIIPGNSSCHQMFKGCSSLKKSPVIYLQSTVDYTLIYMFQDCSALCEVRVLLKSIATGDATTYNWLYNVSPTGDFYCPAELTIPTGGSGIPTGWTRHDI